MEGTMSDAKSRWLSWYAPGRKPAPGTFEIGLSLAGAVSAGAYTAGVLDFLFEALDSWYAARHAGADVPRHDVQLRVVSGASAGGMNGAIIAAALSRRFTPAAPGRNPRLATSPFYRTWVDGLDIHALLATDDLDAKEFGSLLNTRPLDALARQVADFLGEGEVEPWRRAWVADPLLVTLTLANLQGVPYPIRFAGETGFDHPMRWHADSFSFGSSPRGAADPERLPPGALPLPPDRTHGNWTLLQQAALATGAFPGALKHRHLSRPRADYDTRVARRVGDSDVDFVAPRWPKNIPGEYGFTSVDGGLFNNEPFEFARVALSGLDGSNPRDGRSADRAVVMVDPFADPPPLDAALLESIPAVLRAMLPAMMAQGRFKPGELELAANAEIYSRFLVAPNRKGKPGSAALATGGLGGFVGFFSRAYRDHDFRLGRKNCQSFLRNWFALPATNDLVRGTDARWACPAKPGHFPVIPLVGACADPEPEPTWPRGGFGGYGEVRKPLEKRAKRVVHMLAELLADKKDRNELETLIKVFWRFADDRAFGYLRAQLDAARDAVDAQV
jgi:hypothetical protein